MKYLAYPSGIVVEKVYDKDGFSESYAISDMWGGVPGWGKNPKYEKRKLSSVSDGKAFTAEVSCRTYPELTEILRNSGTVVSNAFVARDIRDLFEVVMKSRNDITRDYLVESVRRSNGAWVVEAKYWGNVDDSHRRPSKIVHRILVNQSNQLRNVVEELHPRPMDTEEWKHRTNASTATNQPVPSAD
jgi:hypothetical protein